MVFDKILVPTDGSEYTKAAVRRAMDLAKLSSGKITALYVMDQTIFTNVPMDTAVMNVYRTLRRKGKMRSVRRRAWKGGGGQASRSKLAEGFR